MSDTQQPKRLTTQEAVEYFDGKVSKHTLSNWRSQGKGPKFLRMGGKVLYPIEELERFERESLYSSTSNYKPN